jgi:hypothetical protein
MLAKQVLYCLNHTSSSFCSDYVGDGVLHIIFPDCPQTVILLISTSQVARITIAQLLHLILIKNINALEWQRVY